MGRVGGDGWPWHALTCPKAKAALTTMHKSVRNTSMQAINARGGGADSQRLGSHGYRHTPDLRVDVPGADVPMLAEFHFTNPSAATHAGTGNNADGGLLTEAWRHNMKVEYKDHGRAPMTREQRRNLYPQCCGRSAAPPPPP